MQSDIVIVFSIVLTVSLNLSLAAETDIAETVRYALKRTQTQCNNRMEYYRFKSRTENIQKRWHMERSTHRAKYPLGSLHW